MLIRGVVVGVLCLVGLMGFSSKAHALYEVFFEEGLWNETTELAGASTTGDKMVGMNVTAWFTDGGMETVLWESLGYPNGEARGVNYTWWLYEHGDTFGSYGDPTEGVWELHNESGHRINRLLIDAGAGNTLFDTAFGDLMGTPGSGFGRDWVPFSADDHNGLEIHATYIDEVFITGNAPVGDVYRYLELDFNGIPFHDGRTLRYYSDTDNIRFAGDINPIPEPGSLLLLSTGLLGYFGYRRRRSS
jgi:hypothetical protein